jgi:hypothetical protein
MHQSRKKGVYQSIRVSPLYPCPYGTSAANGKVGLLGFKVIRIVVHNNLVSACLVSCPIHGFSCGGGPVRLLEVAGAGTHLHPPGRPGETVAVRLQAAARGLLARRLREYYLQQSRDRYRICIWRCACRWRRVASSRVPYAGACRSGRRHSGRLRCGCRLLCAQLPSATATPGDAPSVPGLGGASATNAMQCNLEVGRGSCRYADGEGGGAGLDSAGRCISA